MMQSLAPELATFLAQRLLAEALRPLQQLGLSAWHCGLASPVGRCVHLDYTLDRQPAAHRHGHAVPMWPRPWYTQPHSSSCTGQHRGYATARPTRTKREGPEASGPKVTTTAPWPWIDTHRPYILPQWVGISKPAPVSLPRAIQQVKANVQQAAQGNTDIHLSGRPRLRPKLTEAIELNVHFLTDPRNSDQIIRGIVLLPHGTGKSVRIAVFAKGAAAETAKQLGVDVIGDEVLIQSIITSDGESINFDRLVATPEFAKPLARAGRILGPKGLMPNPKMGTLTEDIAGAVQELRAGRVEFRVGRDRQLQLVVGKADLDDGKLLKNMAALLGTFLQLRPKSLPGSGLEGYISGMELKSSHTSTVRIDPASCEALAAEAAAKAQAAASARAAEAEADEAAEPSSEQRKGQQSGKGKTEARAT